MDTFKLFDYNYELVSILDYKEYYYENLKRFNTFSKKAFLRSIDIPPAYFLEQPEDTQDILINNKYDIISSKSKYVNKVIVILIKDDIIVNCTRVDHDEALASYEWLKTLEDESNVFEERSFNKDGILTLCKTVDNDGNTLRNIYLDIPMLLNKNLFINLGRVRQSSDLKIDTTHDIVYYDDVSEVCMSDYQHSQIALNEYEKYIKDSDKSLYDITNLMTCDSADFLSTLAENKIISNSLFSRILMYIQKNNEFDAVVRVSKIVEQILYFTCEMNTYKPLFKVRSKLKGMVESNILDKKQE